MKLLAVSFLFVFGLCAQSAPASVPGAAREAGRSMEDRVRIALLVYTSQSARQADLRKGDEATRAIRKRAETAEARAKQIRVQLAAARLEGSSAEKRISNLSQQLESQERLLSETAEQYTAELARRDVEYARERSILVSTGERLLKTPEGRRVLDLYNAGGVDNWKEARIILEEARRLRRSLDARDAATLYWNAMQNGRETAHSVITVYEELVRDDPSVFADWTSLAILYANVGSDVREVEAYAKASKLAANDGERWAASIGIARSKKRLNSPDALAAFDEAIRLAQATLAASPTSIDPPYRLAQSFWESAYPLLEHEDWVAARDRLVTAVRYARMSLFKTPTDAVRTILIRALVDVGATYQNTDHLAEALQYQNEAVALAREFVREKPRSTDARDALYFSAEAAALVSMEMKNWNGATALLLEARDIALQMKSDDPGLRHPNVKLVDVERFLGAAYLGLNKPSLARPHFERSVEIVKAQFKDEPWTRQAMGDSLASVAQILDDEGDRSQAILHYEEASKFAASLLKESPSSEFAQVAVTDIKLGLAHGYLAQGQLDLASRYLGDADAIIRAGLKARPTSSLLFAKKSKAETLRTAISEAQRKIERPNGDKAGATYHLVNGGGD